MDNEGYPEKHELEAIENWDYRDVFNLIDYIEERWCYNDYFVKKWGKDRWGKHTLFLELHTAGWSGNEDIIAALQKNPYIFFFWHTKWTRGGHWYFEISPSAVGFQTAKEIYTAKGISRQAFHKMNRLERLQITTKTALYRPAA